MNRRKLRFPAIFFGRRTGKYTHTARTNFLQNFIYPNPLTDTARHVPTKTGEIVCNVINLSRNLEAPMPSSGRKVARSAGRSVRHYKFEALPKGTAVDILQNMPAAEYQIVFDAHSLSHFVTAPSRREPWCTPEPEGTLGIPRFFLS